jgi:3-deoxy-manno-octulosonate cytidylyltransferase (CMP-KDO synthetase)
MPPIIGVIPARLGSTRLPGKVLLDRTGKPLIQHVWEAASKATRLSDLYVATDDKSVADAVARFGGRAVLTSPDHQSGTSRVRELAATLGIGAESVVVNIQGDEPEIDPAVIDAGVDALLNACSTAIGRSGRGVPVATVASPFFPGEDPANPAIVKVVVRRDGSAMYFSRGNIPFNRAGGGDAQPPLKHVGIYVYRRWFLDRYAELEPTPLEKTEVLEQLRILEHGFPIAVAIHPTKSTGIDTPEQYEAFVARRQGPGKP